MPQRTAGKPGITALEELCARGEQAVADGDVELVVATNAAFHAKVMELAGNVVLGELAGQVDRRVRWYYQPVARQRGKQSWIEHRELIAAIAQRDEARATAVMRAHTEHTRETYHRRDQS